MKGPNNAAGLKILVHDQQEVPLVRELGQAIPPSSKALVGLQILQVNNLKHPYGKCDDRETLDYYDLYSIPGCKIECKLRHVGNICKCREVYMPASKRMNQKQNYPVCNFRDMKNCVMGELKKRYPCSCSMPCSRTMYEASISYSTTSEFDTDRILHGRRVHNLKQNYIKARETGQKVKPHAVSKDREKVEKVMNTSEILYKSFIQINSIMINLYKTVKDKKQEHECRYNFHRNFALPFVVKFTTFGFLATWQSFEDELLSSLTTNMRMFTYDLKLNIQKAMVSNSTKERNLYLWQAEKSTRVQRKLAKDSVFSLVKVRRAFESGKPYKLSNLDFRDFPEKYKLAFVPGELLSRKWKKTYEHFVNLEQDVNATFLNLTDLHDFLKSSKPEQINDYLSTLKSLRSAAKRMVKHRQYIREDLIYSIRDELERKLTSFDKKFALFLKERSDLLMLLGNVDDLMNKLNKVIWPFFESQINLSKSYISAGKNSSKTELAEKILSGSVTEKMQQFQVLFNDIRARTRNYNHDWKKFTNTYLGVLVSIGDEEITKKFYMELADGYRTNSSDYRTMKHPNFGDCTSIRHFYSIDLPWKTINMTRKITSDIERVMGQIQNRSDMSKKVGDTDDRFFKAFSAWRQDLEKFKQGNEIDVAFIRSNFMEVDVFMKELYYEHVEQQVGYEVTNLWSDIGGSLGLFIGASVLTMCELADAVIHNFFKVLLEKKRARALIEEKRKQRRMGLQTAVASFHGRTFDADDV